MNVKIIGAILIVVGSACFGFLVASAHRKETRYLRNLLSAIGFMICQMQYHLTELPDSCRKVAENYNDSLGKVFIALAKELENQVSPEVKQCMLAAVASVPDLPPKTKENLISLGSILGHFDMDGQIDGLKSIQNDIRRILEEHINNQDVRLRSYQTLGVCAGAAIVILFI